ncbi:DUF6519 domain-containing protein [Massilia sp. TSP1-1-2]|uniref:DUF6519 domain-containing protein n=1 Tax=Massilia sp. TSP1-1-2 TaxID=2804649 RepID=UPI003CF6C2A3
MKADLTRLTYQQENHYRSVRMQQGRVQLDADWNEQQDILNHRIEGETVDTLGHAAGPLAKPGFTLTAFGKNVLIGAGRYYVEGIVCENAAQVSMTTQPDFPAAASPIVPPGAFSIDLPPAGAPRPANIIVYDGAGAPQDPPDGVYIAYLELWQRHLTVLEQPLMREVALGGPDTATREKTLWQVKLLRAGEPGEALTCLSDVADWNTLTAPPTGQLAARAEPGSPPKDPCLLSPDAGYRRLENQLYRVEIHDDGSQTSLRYKWSRNNGFLASKVVRWLGSPIADECEVDSIGRDATLAIVARCWLEFFDDNHELLGLSGTLVRVLKTAGNVVTLDLASATGSLDQALFLQNPRVRVWEDWGDMTLAAPGAAGGWVELEDGVEIKFTSGSYRMGDYWTIPARTASADIEWPREPSGQSAFIGPQGVLRAFARLAMLSAAGGTWSVLSDCRSLFPALSELTNLVYVGGDGQEIMPDFLDPANNLLPSPLEVGVFNGQYPVAGAALRFTASDGFFPGGGKVEIATTAATGIAAIGWTLDANVLDQRVTVELLEAGQTAPGKFASVHFSARLLVAAQVAYDASKCADLAAAGVSNVQDAIDVLCTRTHGGGCCVTVGKEGSFPTLDVALRTLLEQEKSDICICLLPGEHHLGESGIDQQAPGLKLLIHGAGRASRLMFDGQELNFLGMQALTLRDFDLINTGVPSGLRVEGTAQVQLHNLHIGGMSEPGQSLVRLSDAGNIDMRDCRLSTFQKSSVEIFGLVLAEIPLLRPLERSLQLSGGELFRPITADVVGELVNYDEAQRRELIKTYELFVRKHSSDGVVTTNALRALSELAETVSTRMGGMAQALDNLRTGLMLNTPGFALMLGGTPALASLSDNQINGRLSVYGESSGGDINEDGRINALRGRVQTGAFRIRDGRCALRIRNNEMREMRLGDEWLRQSVEGNTNESYGTLIAEGNTMVGYQTQMLAFDLALCHNVLHPYQDVGTVFATQAKYLGNFAHNDFRIFNVGNVAEKFGNGALNIV